MKSISRHILVLIIAIISISAALTSCSGVKNLRKPALELPSEIIAGANDSLSYSDMTWWEYYTDPTLKGLISRALEHNRDMLGAAARVEELRQLYGIEKLNYTPVITGIIGGHT